MSLELCPLLERHARQACAWPSYGGQHAIYDLPSWEEACSAGWGIVDPHRRRREFAALLDADGELVGYLRFVAVPGGVLLGIGLRPDRCDRGLGALAMELAVAEAHRRFTGRRLGLEVRSFNTRAIRCYQKAGFRTVATLRRRTGLGPGEFRVMAYGDPDGP